jgi:CelD/BcsL family acetyltransferase involved in cellulose biosynthesis
MDEITLANEPCFDFCSPEYHELYAASATTGFQSPLWLHGLHTIVARDLECRALTVTGRSRTGRLVFVAPMMRQRQSGVSRVTPADFGLCDYQHLIYAKSAREQLLSSDLATQMTRLLAPCDYVSFEKLTGDDPVLAALFPGARRSRMRISTYPAQLSPDWGSWKLQHLERDFARYLDRKRRRLNRAGATRFEVIEDPPEIMRVLEHIRRFRADRFAEIGAPDITARDEVFRFYCAAAVKGARRGSALTFCLYFDNEPISAIFGVTKERCFWLVLAAFDTHRHRGDSVGLLGAEDSLRVCVERGIETYDFTIGDHAYKTQFGAATVPLFEMHLPLTVKGRVAVVGLEVMRELKRNVRPFLVHPAKWGTS